MLLVALLIFVALLGIVFAVAWKYGPIGDPPTWTPPPFEPPPEPPPPDPPLPPDVPPPTPPAPDPGSGSTGSDPGDVLDDEGNPL